MPEVTGLEFTSALFGQILGWPIVAVLALVLFRKPLGELVGKLSEYDGPGGKLSFSKGLSKVQEENERRVESESEVKALGAEEGANVTVTPLPARAEGRASTPTLAVGAADRLDPDEVLVRLNASVGVRALEGDGRSTLRSPARVNSMYRYTVKDPGYGINHSWGFLVECVWSAAYMYGYPRKGKVSTVKMLDYLTERSVIDDSTRDYVASLNSLVNEYQDQGMKVREIDAVRFVGEVDSVLDSLERGIRRVPPTALVPADAAGPSEDSSGPLTR